MKVGVLFPSRFDDPGEFLADARAMEAADVDSIWLDDSGEALDPMLLLAAVAAVTSRMRLGLIRAGSPSPLRGGSGRGLETLQQLSRRRVMLGSKGWRRVEIPTDREAWAKTLAVAEDENEDVLVPLGPGLLDILRHPDEAIDRSDLQLAQG